MRINLEDIKKLEKKLKEINSLDLNEVELYFCNKKINITKDAIKEWKFTGLTNYYFFIDEAYKPEHMLRLLK